MKLSSTAEMQEKKKHDYHQTSQEISDQSTGFAASVYKYSHGVSDLSELLRNVLGPLMEEERAASLRLLDVASSFSSWKTGGHGN